MTAPQRTAFRLDAPDYHRVPIYPNISLYLFRALLDYCQAYGKSQRDVVEEALVDYFQARGMDLSAYLIMIPEAVKRRWGTGPDPVGEDGLTDTLRDLMQQHGVDPA